MTRVGQVTYTGRSIARSDDPMFLTGAAVYIADVDDERLAGRAHVAFVRSPFAHAVIESIDTSAAEARPDVVGVFTAADIDAFQPGAFAPTIPAIFAQPLLAESKVRFVGEPVAAVVAESPAAALDATELVEVSYEPLPAVVDLDDALSGETLLFDETNRARLQPSAPDEPAHTTGNLVLDIGWHGSEIDDGPSPFDEADVVIRLRTMNPRQSPAPIETRGVVCHWQPDGDLVVWSATQRPHGHRNELSALYGIDPSSISVIAGPEVGGGFGGKNSRTPEERVMPWLSRAVGRPVGWIETRTEYLQAATQSRGERIDFVLAGSSDGTIEALRAELLKDGGAYPMTGVVLPAGYTLPMASGCYDIAHVEFRARAVATNTVVTSAFRGAGRAPYVAGLERLVDMFAAEIGQDPADVRRNNLVTRDQMPFHTPTGAVYDEADYPADLERALTMVDYEQQRRDQARRRADGANSQLGIGIACYSHMTVGGGGEEASVTVLGDGSAQVVTGSTSQGHGHSTTWAQLASDVLGIPPDRISVVEGRTDAIATGVGAVGSRSLQTAGIAIHRAANQVVDLARALAAELLEASPGDVVLDVDRGQFHVVGTPARGVGWEAIAADALESEQELSCGEFFDNEGRNTYPSGTHVAVVEVDIETGAVTIVRYVGVDDAGVVVNPMIVEGQLHGGIAAGLSQVLGEVVSYDEQGNLRTSTFIDYGLATADELPSFELETSAVATSFNELGFKGVGESGTVGATPALHNAIVDALRPFGVDHLDLPCTAHRVWQALYSARSASG